MSKGADICVTDKVQQMEPREVQSKYSFVFSSLLLIRQLVCFRVSTVCRKDDFSHLTWLPLPLLHLKYGLSALAEASRVGNGDVVSLLLKMLAENHIQNQTQPQSQSTRLFEELERRNDVSLIMRTFIHVSLYALIHFPLFLLMTLLFLWSSLFCTYVLVVAGTNGVDGGGKERTWQCSVYSA